MQPDTVILELSNPDFSSRSRKRSWRISRRRPPTSTARRSSRARCSISRATSRASRPRTTNAALNLEAQEKLYKDGLVSEIQLKQSRSRAEELKNRLKIGKQRLEMQTDGIKSQLAPQEADVDQKRAAYELRVRQLDDLKVKAGMNGVLQEVPVERGAQVGPGTNLARVADPTNLKAELRIAETQTKDIRIGQIAEVDTRNGIVKGKVARIDPKSDRRHGRRGRHPRRGAAVWRAAGSRASTGRSSSRARQRHLRRPAGVRPGEQHRRPVQADRRRRSASHEREARTQSVNQIEIVEGLQPGDQVILSDMSAQDSFDRIRIAG